MFKKVDHIGIAVSGLEEAIDFYTKMLGKGPDHLEEVADQKVRTAFFAVGETNLELLFPTSSESPVAKHLEKRGAGIHHICLEVHDIDARLAELKAKGVKLVDEVPRMGAHGKRIAFVHPKSTGGVLVELSEPVGDAHHS